jgi:hypothetical protein
MKTIKKIRFRENDLSAKLRLAEWRFDQMIFRSNCVRSNGVQWRQIVFIGEQAFDQIFFGEIIFQ